jgi:hypothetical protein
MPGVTASDQVVLSPPIVPIFEGADLHRYTALPSDPRHPFVRINPKHVNPTPHQGRGQLSRAAPNVKGRARAGGNEIVNHLIRVTAAVPLVSLRDGAEADGSVAVVEQVLKHAPIMGRQWRSFQAVPSNFGRSL